MKQERKKSPLLIFLMKPLVKNFIIAAMSVALTLVSALCIQYPWLPILIGIVDIIVIVLYAVFEHDFTKDYKVLKKENKTFKTMMMKMKGTFQFTSTRVNRLIHEIVEQGTVSFSGWNFDDAAQLLCEELHEIIDQLVSDDIQFGVGYVRLSEPEDYTDNLPGENYVYLCAHDTIQINRPNKYYKKRKISAENAYHDTDFFKTSKTKFEILLNEREVEQKFFYRKGKADDKKYSQYIAVPVVCEKKEESKVVGLLEITCVKKSYISSDRTVIESYVNNYFLPYAYLFLLLHKMEKALCAKPKQKSTKEDNG